MKKQVIWLMVPAMALGFVACKKKEEPKAPEKPVAVESPAPAPAPPTPPAMATALSAGERAAKLGFVKHLPQDTEVVLSFYNGSKSAQRIQSTKLWKIVQAQMGINMMDDGGGAAPPDGDEMDEELPVPEGEQDASAEAPDPGGDAEPMGPAALFGTEITIALGKSTGEQTANLLTLNRRMGYFQMRALAKAFVDAAKKGDMSAMESGLSNQYGPELLKDLLADSESGVGLFEKMHMPPLYLAFRPPSSGRAAAAQQLASLTENLAMLGDMVEPVEVEKAGQKFSGHRISGAKISASMADSRKEMEEMLDPAAVDKLLAAIAKKDLVAVSGTIGDYVILFIGSSTDDLKFAPDLSQSLVSSDTLAFSDVYASKELAALIYGQKGALDLMTTAAGGLSDMAAGLRDGLSGSDALGDTRDLETLLRMVADREAALRKLAGNESLGIVAFFEDGMKIESFGGTDNGVLDWKAPNKMASLGDSENVVMFANMTTEAAYDDKARAYAEALLETSYAAAMKVSELQMEDGKMAQYKEIAKMFDTKFRPDVVALWDTFSGDFNGSLGHERAWVVDLNGAVPAIPGIPQAVIDEGKFPRVSMLAPVADRAKLGASWQKMNTSLTSVLAKVGEMTGQEIPMQKPISSEKNGFTTWFFPLPFFNDDFMPSVTVGDQWFAASTSKNQALDLIDKAAAGGQTRTGMYFTTNFKALEKFSHETFKVLRKNSKALGIPDDKRKDAEQLIEALGDLDKLTVHARREGGMLRSSVHLKTR
jgi:hypothetical protein